VEGLAETPVSTPRASANALAPIVALDVNGLAASVDELSALRAVNVYQQLSAPARCELWFTDDTAEPPLGRRLVPGALLRLAAGVRAEPVFAGEVSAIEWTRESGGRRSLCVQAFDALQALGQRHAIRVHAGKTVLQIATELASGTGLDVRGPGRLPVWPRIIQYRHSDLDFLTFLAARCGLYLDAHAGTLTFLTLDGIGRPKRLTFGENLHEARTETNAAETCRSVSAFGWNPARFLAYEASIDAQGTPRRPGATEEPDGPATNGNGARVLVNHMASDSTHLAAAAEAAMQVNVRRSLTLTGIAGGDPGLRPGARVDISGLAAHYDGRWVVTSARHTIDRRVYLTEFSTRPPAGPPEAGGFLVVPGEVRRTDDPDRLGRVRVALPTMAGLETDWLHVLASGADGHLETTGVPAPGAHVLALVSVDNPATGIVLGRSARLDADVHRTAPARSPADPDRC
jgi:phage protein D